MTTQQLDQETIAFVKDASAKLQECATRLKSRIKDQDELIDLALASVVSSGEEEVDELFIGGGHMLIMGPPGTGKTRFVKELSTLLNLQMKRIQGTNDLTPADLLGYEVTREHANGDKYLEFIPGPIFTQMLFVDEITRMSPKTQSALLQAMSEGFVTVNGKRYELPHPFMVIATCNPRDTEGSNPLPQAQLDRFRSRPVVGNISFHDEMEIARNDVNRPDKTKDLRQKISVLESQGKAVTRENMRTAFGQQASAKALQPVLGPNDVAFYQSLSRDLPISENLLKDITTFIRKLRPQEESADPSIAGEKILNSGTDGQRTGESIRSMVRGLALVRGDFAPGKEHLKTVAYPIAGHRLSLRSARDIYKTEKNIVQAVLDSTLG